MQNQTKYKNQNTKMPPKMSECENVIKTCEIMRKQAKFEVKIRLFAFSSAQAKRILFTISAFGEAGVRSAEDHPLHPTSPERSHHLHPLEGASKQRRVSATCLSPRGPTLNAQIITPSSALQRAKENKKSKCTRNLEITKLEEIVSE